MYRRLDALKARILVVSLMFLASACVIQRANDQSKAGDEPVQPAAPATKAEPEKPETAVAKTPASPAKPATTQAKAAPAKSVAAPTVAAAPAPAKTAASPQPAAKQLTASIVPAKAADKKFSRVARYVGVENLNVRSRAEAHAPIVGRLARGSMITVSVDGAWAKIGESQFVAVKHLTKSQPQSKRLVSRK